MRTKINSTAINLAARHLRDAAAIADLMQALHGQDAAEALGVIQGPRTLENAAEAIRRNIEAAIKLQDDFVGQQMLAHEEMQS